METLKIIEQEFTQLIDNYKNGKIELADVALFLLDIAVIADDEIYKMAREVFQNSKKNKRPVGKPPKIKTEDVLILKILGKTQKQIADELKISISSVRRAWKDVAEENKIRKEINDIKLGG